MELELTPFHGHPIDTKQGVKNAQTYEPQATVSARVSPADGRTSRRPSELPKEFRCHETSMLSWVRIARAATPSLSEVPAKLHDSERAELIALREENRLIKLQRDILAKATASFANSSATASTPFTR